MILKIFGLALVGAILCFVLKAFGWRGAPLVAVGGIIALISLFAENFDTVRSVFDIAYEVDGALEAGECLLKILGIGYLSGICSDICSELGEAGIASAVRTVARLECLAVLSPLILEIVNLGLELVK